jgi:hypothetical protein
MERLMPQPTYQQLVQELLKPEAVFDLNNEEHRQLLIKHIEREWADSMTVGLCFGDVTKAEVVSIQRHEFATTIAWLTTFQPEAQP